MKKLTANQVRELRLFHNAGFSLKQLAKHYGIAVKTIMQIVGRRRWKQVY